MATIAPAGGTGAAQPRWASADDFRLWLSERLPGEDEPVQLIGAAAQGLGRYLSVTRVGYGEIEPGQPYITIPHDWTDGVVSRAGRRRPYDPDAAVARHFRAGKALVVADIAVTGFGEGGAGHFTDSDTRSFVGVPLIAGGELVALFTADHWAPRPWSEEEVALIAHTGERLRSALDNLRATERLRESDAHFRTLSQNMPGICWLADAAGRIAWMNDRGRTFHGEVPVHPLGDVHPDDASAAAAWSQALATGTSLEVAARFRSSDGGWRRLLCQMEPVRDASGTVIRWCGVQLDLDGQHRRDRDDAFLCSVGDAIDAENDARHILAVAADMLQRHLGVAHVAFDEADDAAGEEAAPSRGGTVAFSDLAFSDEALDTALCDHLIGRGVRAAVHVPLMERGEPAAVLTVDHDAPRQWTPAEIALIEGLAARAWSAASRANKRARLEEQLADSEALLAAFMEHAPVGMHLKDADGRYLRLNPELATAIDLPMEHILGRHASELFAPEIAARIAAMEAKAMAGEPASEEFVTPPRERYASLLSISFPIAGNAVVKTGGFTLDLTDRKSAEAALQRSRDALYQSEKLSALGSLLAEVSHELNNPLSIVVAQAVMMERQAEGSALAERAFKIRKAADRCARIVQTFLAMARQKKPERTAVDLNAVADAAIELANYGLRADGVGITCAFTADLPRISADSDQLHQIVTNLIVNAQYAMTQSRGLRWLEVRTALGEEPHTVVLEVSDSGPGIPVDMRRRVFEPFYTTKPQGEGTGVGLSFSQGLAEAHGGRLTLVPSERGACFRLTLPIDERNLLPRVEPAPPRPAPTTLRRALIVDDEEEIATSLADFLSLEGFVCDVVVGGAAAQKLLAQGHDYDLVISDLRMPDIDGPALFAWIGDRRPDLVERTAFTTGDTLGTAAARFLADAGRPVLEKPFMPDSIRHFLAEVAPA